MEQTNDQRFAPMESEGAPPTAINKDKKTKSAIPAKKALSLAITLLAGIFIGTLSVDRSRAQNTTDVGTAAAGLSRCIRARTRGSQLLFEGKI